MLRSLRRLTLGYEIETLPLRAPFRISGHTFDHERALVVRLSEAGCEGRGEATGVYYLNDDAEAMAGQMAAHASRIEAGISRSELREVMPPGGARNAVDCALWELEARRARVPVWRMAGLTEAPEPVVTMFTLGADEAPAMAEKAQCFGQAHALKLKLTGDIDEDIRRVRAVRAARPDAWLAVDANQGFTRGSLNRVLPALLEARVALLEQPFPRGHEADLERFDCPIPVVADESVQGLGDIPALAGVFDVLNIKLDKCGGLTEALLMVREARRNGLQVMVGNMLGSSLAMAPAFVLAQLCDYVDLDGPLFLRADRAPAASYEDGRIWCPESVWGGEGADAAVAADSPVS